MGIIIKDTITLNNGLEVTNAYGSIGVGSIVINKSVVPMEDNTNNDIKYKTNFIVQARGIIWTNKSLRQDNRPKLKQENIVLNFENDTFLNDNIYNLIYKKWKEIYTNVEDDI
jgi:hypothetical protein